MAKYVRSKITFTGDPETLVKLAADIKSETDSSPISLARILPLTEGTTPEEIWGVSEEAEETDLISLEARSAYALLHHVQRAESPLHSKHTQNAATRLPRSFRQHGVRWFIAPISSRFDYTVVHAARLCYTIGSFYCMQVTRETWQIMLNQQ